MLCVEITWRRWCLFVDTIVALTQPRGRRIGELTLALARLSCYVCFRGAKSDIVLNCTFRSIRTELK